MTKPVLSDSDFITVFEKEGPTKAARILGTTESAMYERRKNLEIKYHRQITGPSRRGLSGSQGSRYNVSHPHRLELSISDGVGIVGGDAHYWPGKPSVSHRAFVKFCKDLKPSFVIMNGDATDCATISKHPPIGWEKRPTLVDEIEVCKERLSEIERVVPRSVPKVWNLGNHDGRFETRLATVAPEYAKLYGVHLRDHFPSWAPAWSTWVNSDLVVKHRFKGGINAPRNNTVFAGKSIITGHLHSAKVQPFTDYNGTRYGVDTGCLANPQGPQFVDYTEDNPKDWIEAFVVLTFRKSTLLWPELVVAFDDHHVQFRGELIRV